MLNWKIEDTKFDIDNVDLNGSRYLIGNGYMGYRGTLEEYNAKQLVALNMAGLFDRNGDSWRESVNAPNPFYTVCNVGDEILNPFNGNVIAHNQTLNIRHGLHSRRTEFKVGKAIVTVIAERFLSMKDENLAVLKFTVCSDRKITINVNTKVDLNVWSINGNHFNVEETTRNDDINIIKMSTGELSIPLWIYEKIVGADNETTVTIAPEKSFTFTKICGVYWGEKCDDSYINFASLCDKTYETLKSEHIAVWDNIWENSDIEIDGDEEAQKAMRYSIYHLCSIAPRNTEKCGIPARGLSGQVYKGAAFWDTEMFMMPFFSFTDRNVAQNLIKYRINTLDAAKRKAKEFGYEGAFYAWESQETGDDACTLFNVTDVFTNRPMRTYFKDRQIHVSADMIYGLWNYCTVSGDYSVLKKGGLDLMLQGLLFYYSYASFKPLKDRFEIHQVVGPDEYHERVDNNAFTNKMISYSADAFIKALNYIKENDYEYYEKFIENNDISWLNNFVNKLYVPVPDENGIIEQFDGYLQLEDIGLDELKKRILIENEYLGGGNGLATTTRILKQADVVMMLNVFRAQYNTEIKKANWEFYEPYTEHGSSLSACAYAIVAAEIGMTEWAYKYFMKTATIDLTGNTKQYLGSLYIGGTHPAANGGAWNTAIFGFAGVSYTDECLNITPRLPKKWNSMKFNLLWKGVKLMVEIKGNSTTVKTDSDITSLNVTVNGKRI